MIDLLAIFSVPLVALAITQLVGLLFLLAGQNTDDEIIALSGTYWDANPHMLKALVLKNYDQVIGIFTIIMPTILQASKGAPFWTSYICLGIGLLLRFTPLRSYRTERRIKRIKEKQKERSQT